MRRMAYRVAENVAMSVALAFEEHRSAETMDMSAGFYISATSPHAAAVSAVFRTEPRPRSADIVSINDAEVRIIEVKGRANVGPLQVPERELETMRCAGMASWLYAVWNCTQAGPVQLWVIQNPGDLPWIQTVEAERSRDQPRGVQHETIYHLEYSAIGDKGRRIDLPAEILELARNLKMEAYEQGEIRHKPH